jgi:hypothetical protein
VSVNVAALGRKVGKDQESCGSSCLPSEPLGRNPPRKPHLLVVLPQRPLNGHHLGFDLHDQQRTCRLVPGEQVDRAALSVHRVRNLGPGDPTGSFEELGDPTDKRRVAFIHQAVEVAATPSEGDDQLRVEGAGDRARPSEWHIADPPAFDP